jgi:hypothetical protein
VSRLAAATDAAAILLFVTIGQLSHRGGVSAVGYAEDALPFLAGWFAVSATSGGRFVPTWLGGTTLGVAVRLVALSHYRAGEAAFWLVALVFLGVVAGLGRLAGRAVAV